MREVDIMESSKMTVPQMIERAIQVKGMMKKDVAEKMGWSAANFANRLKGDSLSSKEWIKMASILGYDVQMVDKENNEVLKVQRQSHGPRVTQMIDGYVYDTDKAEALCHTPQISSGWFELFKDIQTGNFFTVARIETQGSACMALISSKNAKKFYEDCGGEEPDLWFK